MDLKDICEKVEIIASGTAEFIRKQSEEFDLSSVKTKGLHDFVSHVDIEVEKMLVDELGKLIPEAGFLVEEATSEKRGTRYSWIVDPLDGTTNFLHKLHPYSISIGLSDYDEVVAGVVYEAAGNESFMAWKNGGAWLNGKKIEVSGSQKISDSLIATGFPYKDFSRLKEYLKCFEYFLRNSQGVRRMGSASVDLAYVACGRFDAFFEYALNPWDVAAGTILVREAGGVVSDFSANKSITGFEIIAANKLVYSEFLEIVSKFMVK